MMARKKKAPVPLKPNGAWKRWWIEDVADIKSDGMVIESDSWFNARHAAQCIFACERCDLIVVDAGIDESPARYRAAFDTDGFWRVLPV
jgi:hypothetical protein